MLRDGVGVPADRHGCEVQQPAGAVVGRPQLEVTHEALQRLLGWPPLDVNAASLDRKDAALRVMARHAVAVLGQRQVGQAASLEHDLQRVLQRLRTAGGLEALLEQTQSLLDTLDRTSGVVLLHLEPCQAVQQFEALLRSEIRVLQLPFDF